MLKLEMLGINLQVNLIDLELPKQVQVEIALRFNCSSCLAAAAQWLSQY